MTSLTDKIITIIVVVWVTTVTLSILDRSFSVPDSVHLLMSAVVAFLLSGKGVKKIKDSNGPNT